VPCIFLLTRMSDERSRLLYLFYRPCGVPGGDIVRLPGGSCAEVLVEVEERREGARAPARRGRRRCTHGAGQREAG